MDIKAFKKEQAKKTPYQKISQKLTALNHEWQKDIEVSKLNRKILAEKMRSEDRVDLDLHNESERMKKGHKSNYK